MMPTNECVEVQNGGYYIAGTRIGLDVVTYDFRRGRSAEAIFETYPSIGSLAKVYGAITFILEHAVDVRDNLRAGSEIRSDSKQAAILGRCNHGFRERVGLHVSAAKAIDRLLGVSHQEQRPGTQDRPAPSRGLRMSGYAEYDFRLYRISVLEFIDQQVRTAAGEPVANFGMLADQRSRLPQQVIEIKDGRLALATVVRLDHPG